jgi:hypothetical protein
MGEIKLSDVDLNRDTSTPYVFKNIDSSDTSLTPFTIHKSWTVTSGSSTSSCLPLNAIYFDTNVLPALGSTSVYNDASNIDGSLQTVIYYSINKLFYKNKQNLYVTLGPNNPYFHKYLYTSASILSFPYLKVGEGIKSKSFQFQTITGSYSFNFQSDEYGNVYDTQLNSSSIISNCKFYDGFNQYFDTTILSNSSNLNDTFKLNDRYITGSVLFTDGIKSTSGQLKHIGHSAVFNQTGYFIIPNSKIDGVYDRDSNYAISFFISASTSNSNKQTVITKRDTRSPYDIILLANKRIAFYIHEQVDKNNVNLNYDTFKSMYVTSSTAVSSSWNHVVCQKSGSYMQIYVNGSLQTNVNMPLLKKPLSNSTASARIDSTADTYIGGRSLSSTSYNYDGKLDEVRIYNKSLTPTQVNYLYDLNETGSMLQSNIIGNVYDKHGLVVLSSPNYIYNNLLQTPYTASYKSTITRYELNTIVRISSDEFNSSLNPSLLEHDDQTYLSFVSSSIFNPYITTIGLYNDSAQLIAIGKLATPLKKRMDLDMNIVIRLDLDKDIR